MKVAAVAWKVRAVRSEQEFFDHLDEMIERSAGADLIVLPELVGLELMNLHPDEATTAVMPRYADRYEGELRRLSREAGATIVGGSHLRDGFNVCLTVAPDGRESRQTKNVLTQWESAEWGLTAGVGLCLTPDPRVGVTICYDCEFPASGRALAEAGVLVQCVPAYTEGQRGFQRVRWCGLARATENQIFVVHASLVGALGREPVPTTYGSSAILTPSVEPFPVSAILAETPLNEEGVALADLDFEALAWARGHGDVRNWDDRDRGSYELRAASDEPV